MLVGRGIRPALAFSPSPIGENRGLPRWAIAASGGRLLAASENRHCCPSFFSLPTPMTPPDISLVVPIRDEAGSIGPLAAEIQDQLDKAGISWELVLVDDGSTDGSWEEITATAAGDGRIQGIRHDRGRGKSAALMTGFARCSGRAVAMLDGDGQDDPAEIPKMLALLGSGPESVGARQRLEDAAARPLAQDTSVAGFQPACGLGDGPATARPQLCAEGVTRRGCPRFGARA